MATKLITLSYENSTAGVVPTFYIYSRAIEINYANAHTSARITSGYMQDNCSTYTENRCRHETQLILHLRRFMATLSQFETANNIYCPMLGSSS